jgi:hypothetical protein
MKSRTFLKGFEPLGRILLIGCMMVSLVTALGFAASETSDEKSVCTGADMGEYAKLVFCLPSNVVVEPESMTTENYTGGSDVSASMLLDGSRVGLHLLYPCEAPQKELNPADLKPYLESFNPILEKATYNESIEGPVLWGQIGNQIFISYQPNNQTIALVLMDMNMSENMMTMFLGNLSIAVNEGITPASNCPDTANAANAPSQEVAQTIEQTPATETASNAAVANDAASSKDKMVSGMEAAKARLEAMKKNMR